MTELEFETFLHDSVFYSVTFCEKTTGLTYNDLTIAALVGSCCLQL